MTTSLARLKDGYTNGGRSVALRFMQRFRSVPFTPNQLTTAGFLLNVVAGVLIYEEHWVWAAVVFVAGS
jgi:phosphatidylglycerophosphate synthase